MTHDELQATLSADEEHWWHSGRRQALQAAIDAGARRATRILARSGAGQAGRRRNG